MFRVVALFFSSVLLADAGDYFPLQVGNTWLYRSDSKTVGDDRYRTIAVEATETAGDFAYFAVRYFGRLVLLRPDAEGSIVMLDRASGAEQPWLTLGQPEGSTFATAIDACSTTGNIAARDTDVTTPAGEFAGGIQVTFQGKCADAGITQQFYVPGVGLVSHEETSIAGPRRWELVYYRAGVLSAAGPELSFTMALDAARYSAGSNVGVRLTLRSTNPDPLTLQFPSGQSYDLKIYDQGGKLVFTWSSGRAFTLIVRDEKFGPGERTYALTAPLSGLPPGRYKAQGYLTTNPVMYMAESSFEIVP